MLSKKITIPVVAAAVFGTSLCGANAFAANPYNIVYSGGADLGADNVQINPQLAAGLTPLIKAKEVKITVNSDKWKDGSISYGDDKCALVKYIEIPKDSETTITDGVSFTLSNDQYATTVDLQKVVLDNIDPDRESSGDKFAVGVRLDTGSLYAGMRVYSGYCEDDPDIDAISTKSNERLFVETKISPYTVRDGALVTANDLYFGLTDIDAAQSYKILNDDSKFLPGSTGNMFAKDVDSIQNTATTPNLKNKYREDNNYIYSQYDSDGNIFKLEGDGALYAKLGQATQQQGLDMVFGFAHPAASGIEYYAQQYDITYASDEHGKISGITNESIISGNNPSGSSTTPDENYEFVYWTANVDVELMDGTVIKAGEPITSEQLRQIKVTQPIAFTAIHKDTTNPADPVAAPDTGNPTGEMNAAVVPASIIGALLGVACLARFLARFDYKKVNFKK